MLQSFKYFSEIFEIKPFLKILEVLENISEILKNYLKSFEKLFKNVLNIYFKVLPKNA